MSHRVHTITIMKVQRKNIQDLAFGSQNTLLKRLLKEKSLFWKRLVNLTLYDSGHEVYDLEKKKKNKTTEVQKSENQLNQSGIPLRRGKCSWGCREPGPGLVRMSGDLDARVLLCGTSEKPEARFSISGLCARRVLFVFGVLGVAA